MRITREQFLSAQARSAEKKEKRAEKAKTLWPKKVKRVKTPSLANIEKATWEACSEYIRERDKRLNNGLCWYCGTRPIECAMHRIKRGRRATKYDERNLVGGCNNCNGLDGPFNQSQMFDAIFIRKRGVELFLELEAKSREFCARDKMDLLAKTAYFKAKTAALRSQGPCNTSEH